MPQKRHQLEKKEAEILKPYAVLSGQSRGRVHPEEEDERLCFQRDRDRVLHSRAFRRLRGKTQVFWAGHGDHFRDRLTHSLEVSQVSRGLARSLGLNEDLAECIALAHDLGHTPFGHAGEFTLNECLEPFGMSFEHNAQSLRVVTDIEQVYPNFKGLNLSLEVLEGMMKHETFWDKPENGDGVHPSLEAQLVNFADEIAYQNHDTDDGLRSELFTEEDLMGLALWKEAHDQMRKWYGEISDEKVRRARIISQMISLMMADLSEETERRIAEHGIQTLQDVLDCPHKLVGYSKKMEANNKALKEFLLFRFYLHPSVKEVSESGQKVLKELFSELRGTMPLPELRDYLAGMTDSFAVSLLASLQESSA